jgi:hypothetical protein
MLIGTECENCYYCHLLTKLTYVHIYLLTYILVTYSLTLSFTPWNIVLLEILTGGELVKKFPAFYYFHYVQKY